MVIQQRGVKGGVSVEPCPAVRTSESDGHFTIHMEGSLSDQRINEAREVFEKSMAAGCCSLALDFREVDFVSSEGIATLIGFKKSCMKAQIPIVLFGMNQELHDLFAITHLDQILHMTGSLAEWRATLTLEN